MSRRTKTGRPRGRPRSPRRLAAERAIVRVLDRYARELWSRPTLAAVLRDALRPTGALSDDAGRKLVRDALRAELRRRGLRTKRGAWTALPDGRQLKIPGA